MSAREFMRLVYKLRRAQNAYDESPTSGNLRNKKQLEEQVDKFLQQAGIEAEKIQQMGLIPEGPKMRE